MEEEIWKDIPGYEGRYQASTLGRIRSLDRIVACGKGGKGKRHTGERILRPGPSPSGHLSVVLGKKAHGSQVHQLVMRTFIGEPKPGQEVCHLNGDPTDNRLENLRYDTRRENIFDVFRQGHRWRKLKAQDVLDIRKRRAAGESIRTLSNEYHISEGHAYKVVQGEWCYWWL